MIPRLVAVRGYALGPALGKERFRKRPTLAPHVVARMRAP
jgi:hypothetical protein